MLRLAVTVLACLAISSASAAELTCKQWFDYGQRSHLPHGKSELMEAASAAVTATFDTIVDQHHRLRPRRLGADRHLRESNLAIGRKGIR